jgi:hypothetical protein|tara:strand:- start:1467 stop:3287 length:1821 start_codon:yes stop_codon:yes gene_type:complete
MARAKQDPQRYRPVINIGHPDLNQESVAYQEYWEQELDRCINGFKPKGMSWISGKYYFYLNYYKILGNDGTLGSRKTLISPWYRQMDHEYFDLFETCKKEEKGMIVIKARDKGFSYMNSGMISHEYTFFPFNDVGIAAGLQATADAFFDKTKKGLNGLHSNFKHSFLKDTDGILRSGYKQKNKDGKWEVGGYQSTIICRTMDNPEVFKGERVSLMVFEEAGEFKHLKNAYMSSKACFMDGNKQFGVPVIGGTGGDISKASKDFMDMYYESDAYNLIPMFIPASRAYYGFFDVQTGEEKVKEAEDTLLEDREVIINSGDREAFNLHIQNYPLTIQEAFLNTKTARFDNSLLNAQRSRILANKDYRSQIQRGNLDWDFDQNEEYVVKWRPHPDGPFRILHHPEPDYKDLDIGGIDSYDQDQAGASDSLGSAIIYRRFVDTDKPSDYIVAEYTDRPEKKEDFWDGCLKLAVYYNARMLVEYTKIGILDYFKRMNALKYLKEKPESAHNPGTKTRNRYGVHMNKQVKSLMEDLMSDYIRENVEDIWFLDLIEELSSYGTRNTDRAIAFGLCLIHNVDNYRIQAKTVETETIDVGFKYYQLDRNGLPKIIK